MNPEETPDFIPEDFPKGNPFRVPEGYFDRFPAKLAERMEEDKKIRRFPFPSLLKPAPLLAAACMLIIAGVFGYRMLSGPADPLTEDEISTYVYQEGIIDELEVDDILESTDMAESTDTTPTRTSTNENDEIQHYLLDEDIDDADIINEL
jgi:hypothetical protein